MATEAPKPYSEKRPWGDFIEFTKNTPSTVKIITVNAGESLSLQHHKNRDEFWHVISGEGTATVGDVTTPLRAGSEHFVLRGQAHSLAAAYTTLVVLEIALGDFDENDIVRIQDKYGRASNIT